MKVSDYELVAFDLETTGIDPFYDVPVSYQVGEVSGFVNPGREIPQGAIDIHGITDAMVSNAPSLIESTFEIRDLLESAWQNRNIIIGMNVSYDLTMIYNLLEQYGSFMVMGPVLDVLVIDRTWDKYRKGSRKLSALCEHYGVELKNAHTASADAQACIDIFAKQVEKWPWLETLTMDDNGKLASWYVKWLDGYSDYLVRQGNDPIPKGRYSWPIHSKEV